MTENPVWLAEHMRPVQQYINSLSPFPFYDNVDYTTRFACHHNDYLRLSNHPEVIKARNIATTETGGGAMASIVYGGDADYHSGFRALAAQVLQAPDANSLIIFSSGWSANVGLLEAVVKQDMPIYIDASAHASLWDGARLSPGKIMPVKHNDYDQLVRFIKACGPGVIVLDGYYSTNGSVCPLAQYVQIAHDNDCIIILDEAHSFCMTGEKGGGLAVETGLAQQIHFRTYSLAKALAGGGGLIASNPELSQYGLCRIRPLIFSSSPSPAISAGNRAALSIVIREPERAQKAQDNAKRFRSILNAAGIDTGPSKCQIVSLMFHNQQDVLQLYDVLKKQGFMFAVFLPPAVPRGTGLARFSIHSGLSDEDIDIMGKAVIDALHSLNISSRFPGGKSA